MEKRTPDHICIYVYIHMVVSPPPSKEGIHPGMEPARLTISGKRVLKSSVLHPMARAAIDSFNTSWE